MCDIATIPTYAAATVGTQVNMIFPHYKDSPDNKNLLSGFLRLVIGSLQTPDKARNLAILRSIPQWNLTLVSTNQYVPKFESTHVRVTVSSTNQNNH